MSSPPVPVFVLAERIYILPVLIKRSRPKIPDSQIMSEQNSKRFKFKLPNLEGTYAPVYYLPALFVSVSNT